MLYHVQGRRSKGDMFDHEVAIVGLGAVGASTFVHLVDRLKRQLPKKRIRIHCFETREKWVGAGAAHCSPNAYHVLNTRASTMSIFENDSQDFIRWLGSRANGYGIGDPAKECVPRFEFAHYLKERFTERLKNCPPNIQVKLHFTEVIDCKREVDHVFLKTNIQTVRCDRAIFCLGLVPTRGKKHQSDRFINLNWDFEPLKQISRYATVGILGTSLTAVDVLLTLEHSDFEGTMLCFSRRRSLPKIQSRQAPVQLKHLTRGRLEVLSKGFTKKVRICDIKDLLEKDFREVSGGGSLWNQVFEMEETGRTESVGESLKKVEKGSYTSHSFFDATTDIILDIWNCLEEDHKRGFLEKFEPIWAMFRHSMPVANARKIDSISRREKLKVQAGLESYHYDSAREKFVLVTKHGPQRQTHLVDYLVDATGTKLDFSRHQSALIQSMVARGEIGENSFGGVDVDFETSQLKDRVGRVSSQLYFIGFLTKGVHFYTNSFEMNRKNIVKLTDHLVTGFRESIARRTDHTKTEGQLDGYAL